MTPFRPLLRTALNARAFSTTAPRPVARMTLIGRLASAPEATRTSTDRELIRYSVATEHGPSNAREVSFFRVGCFNETPAKRDFILGLPKGTLVHVDAAGRMSSYEGEDGKKVYRLDLVQSELSKSALRSWANYLGSLDVLQRPRPKEDAEVAE